MSTKTDPAPDQQHRQICLAIEAILRSPRTGSAVAKALMSNAAERDIRTLVADLRARRLQHAYDRDADAREEARSGQQPRPTTPWARPA